jgi:hypothetical protein
MFIENQPMLMDSDTKLKVEITECSHELIIIATARALCGRTPP